MNGTQQGTIKRAPNQRACVLAIDDEPISHEVVAAHLAREGYELVFAENGEQGLNLAASSQPDTILLDLMMPGIDGFEVCRRLKADPTLSHIPIILLTALDDRRYMSEGLGAGADEFITKPVIGDELRARVRSMLRIKRQHDELRKLLRLREELVQMAVHDLRSPLSVIVTYAGLLAEGGPLNETQTQDLAELLRGVERIQVQVDEALMLAKLEEGQLSLQITEIDLNALVQDLLSIYRGSVKRRQLRLELALPDAPLIARGDKNVLYRVFDNLFSNAAKFSPRGGAIRLELGMDQHSVYLLVADQGPGVAEEHRGKVFEKFGIVELRQQQVVQLGFGLAFCKLAVEAHGGTIEIGGNQPQGATFLVRLPATSVTGKSG